MTKKCVNNGNWLNMCESLKEVTTHHYGDIEANVMTTNDRKSSRLEIVAGRFKKNRVALNYCPFCGVDIVTQHKEQSHDNSN
ncbi:hypothetical protein [Acinetobacter guillouiae]|uniref:Uncharacterized protein n=1 Tax=Acinetobacter guillouiae NIPH 991 TaxID=1217656 RepID=N8YBS4_ACIGI|nr:hypothetical protein [Acinetobacter guillouiae]ENV18784.1 hypothetical protein F964_00584 [Acinetobacter guillouiae NIPH 991]